MAMEKIVIVGCPGAGKSTAGRRLAELTGIPLVHLDLHYWRPGWIRPDNEIWRAKVQELIDEPRWIMDGNYSGTLDLRLAAADTLIHLDFSTVLCAQRVARRTLASLGRQRGEELGDGCPERLDWAFFRFVLNYRRVHRQRDMEKMSAFNGTTHRFGSPRELTRFLEMLPASQFFERESQVWAHLNGSKFIADSRPASMSATKTQPT